MSNDDRNPGAAAQENGQGDAEPCASESHEALLLSLQDAQARADEHWNELLRARADLTNLQRRAERDLANAHKYALERFAGELLPVLDGLELGLNAASDGGNPDPERLREGMDLTLKLLLAAVGKHGITPIEPLGQKFNPELHQAMATQPAPGVEPNTIVTVYQKGWQLNDRLLRPAMVVVAAAGGDAVGTTGGGRGTVDETA